MKNNIINTNSYYDTIETLKLNYNIDYIIKKRFLFYDNIEIYINPQYITLYGIPSIVLLPSEKGDELGNNKSFMVVSDKLTPITKEVILNSMGLDINDRYYIGHGSLLIDAKSVLDIDNIAIIEGIKEFFDYMNSEFEEAIDWVNYFTLDYLNQYPEDKVV